MSSRRRGEGMMMIDRQNTQSWEKGRDDAQHCRLSVCPEGFDQLAYDSGYYAGSRARVRRRPVSPPLQTKDRTSR
jgi:hypothetical protein